MGSCVPRYQQAITDNHQQSILRVLLPKRCRHPEHHVDIETSVELIIHGVRTPCIGTTITLLRIPTVVYLYDFRRPSCTAVVICDMHKGFPTTDLWSKVSHIQRCKHTDGWRINMYKLLRLFIAAWSEISRRILGSGCAVCGPLFLCTCCTLHLTVTVHMWYV